MYDVIGERGSAAYRSPFLLHVNLIQSFSIKNADYKKFMISSFKNR